MKVYRYVEHGSPGSEGGTFKGLSEPILVALLRRKLNVLKVDQNILVWSTKCLVNSLSIYEVAVLV